MVSIFWIEAFNRTSGLSTGLDDYYRLRHNGRFVRGGGPPSGQGSLRVRSQGKKADAIFGAQSSGHSGPCREYRASPSVPSASSASPSTSSSKALPMRTPANSARATTRKGGPVSRSPRQFRSRCTPPSGIPEVPVSSRPRLPMFRHRPRMTGGTTALPASVRRKPAHLSLGGFGEAKPPHLLLLLKA
jgi:hypothetical protein